ncbi:MAG TPA: hypothetical protein VII75_10040 [Thermoanaerobaculia bacterium]|nr:hypothetical protein [Thermoanaerobaculia bacterium]
MNIDYANLEENIVDGTFRVNLQFELVDGFRDILDSGERLPTSSHYASQIAEIVNRNAQPPLNAEMAFNLYQEILLAVEGARASVLDE